MSRQSQHWVSAEQDHPREGNKHKVTYLCSSPGTLQSFHMLFSRAEPRISCSCMICVSHHTAFRDTVSVFADSGCWRLSQASRNGAHFSLAPSDWIIQFISEQCCCTKKILQTLTNSCIKVHILKDRTSAYRPP